MHSSAGRLTGFVAFLLATTFASPVAAQTDAAQGFWQAWFARSDSARDSQPHWITPLTTTTPRLEQEFRYDVVWQQAKVGDPYTVNVGNSKGLELIPAPNVEVIVGLPPYIVHRSTAADGFGDFRLLLKYRLAAAPETEGGGYIATAFVDVSFPTGSPGTGQPEPVVTATLAYGKGFGAFDVQGTTGFATPMSDVASIGRAITWNNAFQYHLLRRLWPQIEVNAIWFDQGKNAGQHQVLLTPGLVIGRIPLSGRVGLTFGAGLQVPVTEFRTTTHNIVVSVRLPF